ncbi:MAG TPA: ABC transporter permease [Candidatus Sulfotelmatobacter sp.]|nr:ABC transporter permease [Candidatus Sulfotelmatobacter sp.]
MNSVPLVLHQVRYTNKSFWRNPPSAFFTGVFPIMFLILFPLLFGSGKTRVGATEEVSTSTFYVPAIAAFSIITACYTNIAISVSIARDLGILKRVRGTPLPAWAYLAGRIVHAVLVALLLLVICVVYGLIFYKVHPPAASLPAFVITCVVGAAAFCALGLAVTTIIRNSEAAPAVANATILPLLFISNIFIPLQSAPSWLDTLSKVFPVRHFADAMLTAYFTPPGGSAWSGGDLLVLAIWGAAGLFVAARRFSWDSGR